MLETVRKYSTKKVRKTFEDLYVEYMLAVHSKSILLEMKYIQNHNRLDIMKLDKWVQSEIEEVFR